MSVNASVINQQVIMQQFTTQQTAQQATSTEQDAAATTWQPAGLPSNMPANQQVAYTGQELFLFVNSLAHNHSASISDQQTVALAYFINQFVTACNNDGAQATPPTFINTQTQLVYYALTGKDAPPAQPGQQVPPATFPVMINGTQESVTLEQLSTQILAGGTSGYQAMIAMQSLIHTGNGQGVDPWSPTYPLISLLNNMESANQGYLPSSLSFSNAGSNDPNYNNSNNPSGDNDLQALANQWMQTAQVLSNQQPNPSNPNQITQTEILAQDIVNVNDDLNAMQQQNPSLALSPALQLLSDALNAPVYDGTSMVTLATNVVTDMNDPNAGNLYSAINMFANAYQAENYYIGSIIQEAANPGSYNQIPG